MIKKGYVVFLITVFLIATMAGCTSPNDLDLSKLETDGQFCYPGMRPGATPQEAEEALGFPLGEGKKSAEPAKVNGNDNATVVYYFPEETPFTILGDPVATDYTFIDDSLCGMSMVMEFDKGQSGKIEKLISKLTEYYGEPDINYTEDLSRHDKVATLTDTRWVRKGEGYFTSLVCNVMDLTKTGKPHYSVSLNFLYNGWIDFNEYLRTFEEKMEKKDTEQ